MRGVRRGSWHRQPVKDSAAVAPIVTHRLRDNISVLEGSGGTIAVLSGPDGKVLVDAGIAVSRPQLTRALAELGPEPVTHLINGQTIALKHYRSAHTDSDISVTFAEANVVHVADTFSNGVYPFIDFSTGGSIDGMIAASDANLAATNDDTIIIAGHGKAVGTRAELREFRNMLVAVRDKVAALKQQGRSRADTVAANPTAAFDGTFGNFVIDPAFFTRLVYDSV